MGRSWRRRDPVQAWVTGTWFTLDGSIFVPRFEVIANLRDAFDTIVFVTLDKEAGRSGQSYIDRFESMDTFHWTSQSSTSPNGKKGREIIESLDTGRRIHLFVRRRRADVAFTYAGLVVPLRQEGSQPMTVSFRLLTPLTPEVEWRFLRD